MSTVCNCHGMIFIDCPNYLAGKETTIQTQAAVKPRTEAAKPPANKTKE